MKNGFLPAVLAFVAAVFMGILVMTWVAARNANPVILDESGRPRGAAAQIRR